MPGWFFVYRADGRLGRGPRRRRPDLAPLGVRVRGPARRAGGARSPSGRDRLAVAALAPSGRGDATLEAFGWGGLARRAGAAAARRPSFWRAKWSDAGKIALALGPDVPVFVISDDPRGWAFVAGGDDLVGRDGVLDRPGVGARARGSGGRRRWSVRCGPPQHIALIRQRRTGGRSRARPGPRLDAQASPPLSGRARIRSGRPSPRGNSLDFECKTGQVAADPVGGRADLSRSGQCSGAVRAHQGGARRPAVGNDRRRRQFARRNLRHRLRHRRARPAHALPQARQSQRPRRRGDRGLDGLERRLCRGDRRRPAARRDDPAEDVRPARSRRRQSRDRHARRRRDTRAACRRRGRSSATSAVVLRPDRRRARRRSDERLLHDPARDRLEAGAAPVAGRLQDPGRRRPVGGRRAARSSRFPTVPRAHGGQIEADAAGRPRLPRPRRPPRDRRRCCRSASCCSR